MLLAAAVVLWLLRLVLLLVPTAMRGRQDLRIRVVSVHCCLS